MTKVFIDGKEGTTGLRIYDRLSSRDDIKLLLIDESLRKDASERKKLINESDITFLCLPDDSARESVSLASENVRIIDASTAHRTEKNFAYGFPELSDTFRARISGGNRVAVPGCHASGFASIVYPLVSSCIMQNDYPLSCFSITGYSGGGKKMIAQYEADERSEALDSPRLYGLTQEHKHLKEMKYISSLSANPIFTPIVSCYYSGMAVSVPIHLPLLTKKLTLAQIYEFYSEYYDGKPLISVGYADDSFLPSNSLSGKDVMKITITGNDERAVITSVFDNLGKGASGAAIQCMNIMLGLDETTGLVR